MAHVTVRDEEARLNFRRYTVKEQLNRAHILNRYKKGAIECKKARRIKNGKPPNQIIESTTPKYWCDLHRGVWGQNAPPLR
jgi:hypothetical protein